MNKTIGATALLLLLVSTAWAKEFRVADYGLKPNSQTNASPILAKVIQEIQQYGKPCRLVFETGRYDFHPQGATIREYYISNHDQDNPKTVGMAFENLTGVTIEGNGADLMFHGRMLPVAIVNGKNMTIKNRFINALTSMFQFTSAVISIYPEIPELDKQQKYFHSGIVIEDNIFETFDQPLVYAKSVDGLIFRRNKVIENTDYPAFHQNGERLKFERVVNAETGGL